MSDSEAFQRLSDVLRAHGSQPDMTSLKATFQKGPEAAAWVQRHLTADTLLSRDELDQYTALESSGRAAQLAADAGGLDAVQPLDDAELRAAIEELNRSTSAVARQTEALRQQQDALGRLLKQRSAAAAARADMGARRAHAAEAERRALAAAVEGLAQSVAGRVAAFEEEQQPRQQAAGGAEAAAGRFHAAINDLLQSDDRLLASLQKLGQQLEEQELHAGVERVRETCARLIKHTVEMIRTKLDRTYLEAVESALVLTPAASTEDVKAIEAELEELYTEILPVAQMSAEQQFLEPTVRSLRERDATNLARSSEAMNYAETCLDYLLAKMSTLAVHVEDIKAYESASEIIIRTAKAELASPAPIDLAIRQGGVPNTSMSPTRRPNQAAWPGAGTDASPVKRPQRSRTFPTNNNNGGSSSSQSRRRRSSGLGVPEEAPMDVLLRELALALPDDGDGADGGLADAAALDSALRSRTAKAADVARDAQASFETSAQHHLADSARAVAMLLEGVLSEAPPSPPPPDAAQPSAADDDEDATVVGAALRDSEIEASLAVLNHEVDRVAERIREAEAELRARQAAAGSGKRAASKQEEMVRRWGPVR